MKNLMKKVFASVLVAALCAASFASASIYFERKATMHIFSGRIEAVGDTANSDEGELLLSIGTHSAGVDVGAEGNIASPGAAFPIFTEGARHNIDEHTWTDINGKRSLDAPVFTLRAVDGPITNVNMAVMLSGDLSAAQAVHFGVYAVHYIEGRDAMTRTLASPLDVNTSGKSEIFEIGDLIQGETVEVYLSAWIADYDFARVDYQGGEMFAEAIFSYGEQQ